MPNFAPPLPPGWSEHTGELPRSTAPQLIIVAPNGRTKYYYNSQTKESTYTRPMFTGAVPGTNGNAQASGSTEKLKKKEKPKVKVSIPGTTWQRIKTTEGNVFYFERESKRSEWSVPQEIKAAVEGLEQEEKEKAEAEARERILEEERIKAELEVEKARIRREVEESRKRKAEEGAKSAKRAKVAQDGDGDGEGEGEGDGDDAAAYGPQDEQDEAEWMKAVAAEFAEADAKIQEGVEEEKQHTKEEEEAAAKKVFAVPEKVNVSLEEGKALFRVSMALKSIWTMLMWRRLSLPKRIFHRSPHGTNPYLCSSMTLGTFSSHPPKTVGKCTKTTAGLLVELAA